MQVGISDTAAGHKSGSVPVNFTLLAAAGSGLSNTGAGTQTVQMTGDVYGYAVANTLGTPVPLGNIHAGDSFVAQNVSVQNVAPNTGYYENLEAAAGSWDVTILPGNSANLSAGIVDNTPREGRAGDGQLHLEGNRRRSVGHAVVLADRARHRQRLRLRRGEHARHADRSRQHPRRRQLRRAERFRAERRPEHRLL